MQNPMLSRWYRLYTNQTAAESALEPAVAALGRPYRFNHILLSVRAFPDFALVHDRVVIEVDGASHYRKGAAEKDKERDERLAAAGWRTLRCRNEEALSDPYGTVDRLMREAGLPWRTRKP